MLEWLLSNIKDVDGMLRRLGASKADSEDVIQEMAEYLSERNPPVKSPRSYVLALARWRYFNICKSASRTRIVLCETE